MLPGAIVLGEDADYAVAAAGVIDQQASNETLRYQVLGTPTPEKRAHAASKPS